MIVETGWLLRLKNRPSHVECRASNAAAYIQHFLFLLKVVQMFGAELGCGSLTTNADIVNTKDLLVSQNTAFAVLVRVQKLLKLCSVCRFGTGHG